MLKKCFAISEIAFDFIQKYEKIVYLLNLFNVFHNVQN